MILSFMLVVCAIAQAMDQKMERVNAIKKNPDYLYGEATMKELDEAEALAFELLQTEVDAWLKESATSNSSVDKDLPSTTHHIRQMADTLVLRRAGMYRVFAFLKKSSLQPEPNLQSPSEQETPHTPNQLQVSPVQKEKEHLITPEMERFIKRQFMQRNGAIERIKGAKNFFELKTILPPLKEQGLVADYGKYATAVNPEDCYLIVYDIAGNIKALLDRGETIRLNLKTGKEDSIENYRGCGAIWVRMAAQTPQG